MSFYVDILELLYALKYQVKTQNNIEIMIYEYRCVLLEFYFLFWNI